MTTDNPTTPLTKSTLAEVIRSTTAKLTQTLYGDQLIDVATLTEALFDIADRLDPVNFPDQMIESTKPVVGLVNSAYQHYPAAYVDNGVDWLYDIALSEDDLVILELLTGSGVLRAVNRRWEGGLVNFVDWVQKDLDARNRHHSQQQA